MLTKFEVMFCGRARRSAHVMTLGAPKSGAAGACVLWATDVGAPQQKICVPYRPAERVHWVVSALQGAVSRSTFFKAATTRQKDSAWQHRGESWGDANRDGFYQLVPYCHGGFFRSAQRPVWSEPGLVAQSSPNNYPDPDWDNPSVTAVDEEEEVPDSQRLGAGVTTTKSPRSPCSESEHTKLS